MSQRDEWQAWRRYTQARIALGRSGAGLPTQALLDFGVAHAAARDAIHTPLDVSALQAQLSQAGWSNLQTVQSQAPDRASYLRRPDWGRQLASTLEVETADLVVMVADGLSSLAVSRHVVPLLQALAGSCPTRWIQTPIVIATQARVALGDPVGAAYAAKLVLVLIGERPGLSSPDSLGAYLTYAPTQGCHDAMRNCVSNIRPEGLPYGLAAFKINWLVTQALQRQLTGVQLKDESDLYLSAALRQQLQ